MDSDLTTFLAFDPGADGAYAFAGFKHRLPAFLTYDKLPPEPALIDSTLSHFKTQAEFVYVERVGEYFQRGNAPGAFKFGYYVGCLHAMLQLHQIEYNQFAPNTWQSKLSIRKWAGKDSKQRALRCARSWFPNEHFLPKRCRKPHDGCIDAALMTVAAAITQGVCDPDYGFENYAKGI